MAWIFDPFLKYMVFDGRARRKEFWSFFGLYFVTVMVSAAIDGMTQVPLFSFVAILGFVIPVIAVLVRRLHDIGKSGWWYFVGLVPFVGGIILIFFLARKGDEGWNDYGPDPKAFEE